MEGKTRLIVVTGVTRGLGRVMVEKLVESGCMVAGCGRTPEKIAELRARHGLPHSFAAVDLASDDEVRAWAKDVIEKSGIPDLVINNAALINRNAPLWEIGADEFSRVIDVNLKGVTNVIRHFCPPMMSAGKGVIVNFSSYWGRSADTDVAPYCATKWGIEGMTRALALELPPGIAAVVVNPGIVNTEMLQSCFGKDAASKFSEPEEWAERAVPFLLSLGTKDNGKSLTVPGE
ncbi:MAG: SDR family oxidoreductase [Verrucomicrobia bacterium]|nr:SDR family oxidoreductase [Verrucomicrobiota bacterium]MCF7708789.1 SDR family oxidoreductase [Verrucomicrobiota bacterium]